MKRPLIYAAALAISVIAISIFIGAPSQKWAEIKIGMKAQEIVASLGAPKNNLLDSKSIQIWENDGFIRKSSLAVLYYDPQKPEIATKTIRSNIWIWERL
jgi:hypothetical protein